MLFSTTWELVAHTWQRFYIIFFVHYPHYLVMPFHVWCSCFLPWTQLLCALQSQRCLHCLLWQTPASTVLVLMACCSAWSEPMCCPQVLLFLTTGEISYFLYLPVVHFLEGLGLPWWGTLSLVHPGGAICLMYSRMFIVSYWIVALTLTNHKNVAKIFFIFVVLNMSCVLNLMFYIIHK